MSTRDRVVVEVSTGCECTFCLSCNVGTFGYGPCEWCKGEVQASSECFDCQPLGYLQELVEQWIKKSRANKLVSFGKNMGWAHASGEGELPASFDNVMRFVTLNGEYSLRFVFEPNEPIRVTRFSHDEPTGASFEIFRKVRQYTRRSQ